MAKNREYEDGVVTIIPAGDDYQENATQSGNLEDELRESLKDADETAEVILYRQRTANHKDGMAICESWSADVATWSLIQKAARGYIVNPYDDTHFRAIVRKRGKITEHKPFTLAAKTVNESLPAKGGNETKDVLNTLVQMQREQMAELRSLVLAQPAHDPKQDMKEMFAMMGMMREAMGYSPAGQQTAQAAPVDAVTQLITTLAGLAKLKGLAGELGFMGAAEPAEDANVLSLATKYLPQVLDTVKRSQDLKAATIQGHVLTHQANPAPLPASAFADHRATLEPMIKQLHSMAVNDEDYQGVIEYINGDAETKERLRPIVMHPNTFAELASMFPDILNKPSWWGDFIEDLRAIYQNPVTADKKPDIKPE